jgi:hypothetical protein
MDAFLNAVLLQVLSYGVILLIAVGFIWFLQGNFLFKFIKVKSSRGAAKLIKIREADHDEFTIGIIKEGFLIFKYAGDTRRVPLPTDKDKKNYFYRAMGITWIDYDSEKNCFGLHDYSTVSGHDAIKTQNFLKRILMMSNLKQDLSMMIILLICIAIIGSIAAIFLTLQNGSHISSLQGQISELTRMVNTTYAPRPL